MGNSDSTTYTFTYTYTPSSKPTERGRGANFSTTSFGEGRTRRAYKGTYWPGWYKAGETCVVKEFKESFAWAKTDWDSELKVLKKAKFLAGRFNEDKGTTRPIEYVWSDVWKVSERDSPGTPKLGEWVMVEDYIKGEWSKWNSNAGYVSTTSTASLHAFSHWTYAHTGGKLLVCDLQGVRYNDKYILTDPVICSLSQEYGSTDLGPSGMALFFSTHECTTFCNQLPKPRNLKDDVRELKAKGVHTHRHTSYSSEDEFSSVSTRAKGQMKQKLLSAPGLSMIEEEEEEEEED